MSATSEDLDLFTPVFKHFRRLPDTDCFTEAYSIATHPTYFQQIPLTTSIDLDPSLGLQSISTWSLYSCKFSDGLYFLSNPFTSTGQCQWIDRCVNIYAKQIKTSVGDNSNNENLARIRWATLGYHYDWTNKVYKQDDHTQMPNELAQLCETIMQVITSNTSTNENYDSLIKFLFFRLSNDAC
jgi:hypothetical protein